MTARGREDGTPIQVGVIGLGGVSQFHLRGYRKAGATVKAVAETRPAVLREVQQRWGIPDGYRDYHELLADPEISAVSICLPNALHHPATVAAAAAGKHVLCEKPIAAALEPAAEMIAACRAAGVVLQIGHHLRSDPGAVKARELLQAGVVGEPTFLRLRQAHDWGGKQAVRDSFGKRDHAGGGTLLDNGCHLFDLARYLGGEVRELFARTATRKFDVEVEDTALVSLVFHNGALGSVESAWTATGWEEGFWLYGTEGALEYTNRYGPPRLRHLYRASPNTTWAETDLTEYSFAGDEAHLRSIHYFLEAIRGLRPVICSGEDGLEALRLVLASYRSADAHAPVPVHPNVPAD